MHVRQSIVLGFWPHVMARRTGVAVVLLCGALFADPVTLYALESGGTPSVRRLAVVQHSPPKAENQSRGILPWVGGGWLGTNDTKAARYGRYTQYLLWLLFGVLALVAIIWWWNVRLRILVERQTRELRSSELRFRTIADYALDWENWLGPDGRLQWVSAAVKRATGYTPEECLKMEDYPRQLIQPPDRDRVLAALDGRAGACNVGSNAFHFAFTRKDGSAGHGELHWRMIHAESGEFLGVRFGIRDVSEQLDAQERLQASEKKYGELVQNLRDGFLVMGPDRQILEWNAEFQRMLGYSSDELAHMELSDLVSEVGLAQDRRLLAEQVLPRGYSDVYERELLGKNNRSVVAEIRMQLLRDGNGDPTGYWAIVRDVSERKKSEAEHRQIEERMREVQRLQSLAMLAGGVAHDFNNLLMGVLGNADLAAEDLATDSPLQENFQEIRTAALRGADLCRQMLAYAGKGRFVVGSLSLNRLIRESRRLFQSTVPASIQVHYQLAPTIPDIEGDTAQIRQMLANLLANAVEAIGTEQGMITVRTGARDCDADFLASTRLGADLEAGDYVYVEVTDSGCGMDPETLGGVFDPFFTTKFTGRGLGLPAVLGIVRGHHGTIEVETRQNEGSCFRVLLPAAEEEAPEAAPLNLATSGNRGTTILVVDDQRTVRTVARRMLERASYTVLTANDGAEALKLLEEHAGDVGCVLLDLTMPKLDGAATLRRIRANHSDLPVILSSGYSKNEVTARFDPDDYAAFIQKPYEAPQLIELLHNVMSS